MDTVIRTPSPHYTTIDGFLRRNRLVPDLLLAVGLAILLGGPSMGLLGGSDSPNLIRAVAGLALVVLHASVIIRRVRVLPAYVLAAASMLVVVSLPLLHDPSGAVYPALLLPSTLVFGLILFSAAARLEDRRAVAALAVAVVGVVAAVVRLWQPRGWGGPATDLPLITWRIGISLGLLAAVGCLWSLGRLSRVRQLFLAELRAKAERAETDRVRDREEAAREERDRISREMHDVVSHSLAVMISQAEGGRLSAPDSPSAAVLGTISDVGRDALRDMRGLLGVLRDAGVDGNALAPQPGLIDVPHLLARIRDTGVVVEEHTVGSQQSLRSAVDLAAYRVIQEGMTNVVKHAGPTARAHLTLDWGRDRLVITVEDDGQGVSGGQPGVGLTGMRERLAVVGGSLETTSPDAGSGHRLIASIPYASRNQS